METSYSIFLVIMSFIVATFGSLLALITTRDGLLESEDKRGGLIFLASLCLGGVGIWSMHFIGMLAMTVQGMVMDFNWGLTAFSFIVGVLVVYIGLFIMNKGVFSIVKLIAAGVIVGLGVAAMHYTGMLAMEMQAEIQWNWGLVGASIGIAVTAAIVALWLAVHVKHMWQILLSAIVMGIAVCGMHYTGMFAASFIHNPALPEISQMTASTNVLTLIIMIVDFVVLLLATILAMGKANSRKGFSAV
jgi:NO-binding membrane sensor protein with MHYT domain